MKSNHRDHFEFYKENEDDKIWQADHFVIGENEKPCEDNLVIGELLYSFDKKKIYNLWVDYPYNFTDEELEIFAQEQPYWVDFFKDRI